MNARNKSPFEYQERGINWCPAQVDRELLRLRSLPYLALERWFITNRQLHVTGTLRHTQQETGRKECLRVRMEYPRDYPWEIPSVFDEDKRFAPSADGHQYPDHKLCLSFPLRFEFPVGSDNLATEVLQSSLVWFDKRCIFERLGVWPGAAEEHGYVRPLKLLLREEARRSRSLSVSAWCEWVIAELVAPYPDKGCPCLSGRPFAHCHTQLLWLAILYQCSSQAMRDYEHRAALKAA
jgi:hypothetical protein